MFELFIWVFTARVPGRARNPLIISHRIFYIVTDAHWCCQFKWFRNEGRKWKTKNVFCSIACLSTTLSLLRSMFRSHFSCFFMTFTSLLFISHSLPTAQLFLYSDSLFSFVCFISFVRILKLYETRTYTYIEWETERYSLSVSCCVERVKIASV